MSSEMSATEWHPNVKRVVAAATELALTIEPVRYPDGRAQWEQAEDLTLRQIEPWFGVLDEAGRTALVAGLDGMSAALK